MNNVKIKKIIKLSITNQINNCNYGLIIKERRTQQGNLCLETLGYPFIVYDLNLYIELSLDIQT